MTLDEMNKRAERIEAELIELIKDLTWREQVKVIEYIKHLTSEYPALE